MIFFPNMSMKLCEFPKNMYTRFRFSIFSFVSVNPPEILVSVVSVFTHFGRPLLWLPICMLIFHASLNDKNAVYFLCSITISNEVFKTPALFFKEKPLDMLYTSGDTIYW